MPRAPLRTCLGCGFENAPADADCPLCGASASFHATVAAVEAPTLVAGQAPGAPAGSLLGHVVGGRFRVDALLGRGGMGEVYEALDLGSGEPVALKAMRAAGPDEEPDREGRFQREIAALERIRHAAVPRVIAHGVEQGGPWYVSELVRGRDLRQILRESGPLDVARGVWLGAEVARALAAAHEAGVLHRDVKPANIMLEEEADGGLGAEEFRSRRSPQGPGDGIHSRRQPPDGGLGAEELRSRRSPQGPGDGIHSRRQPPDGGLRAEELRSRRSPQGPGDGIHSRRQPPTVKLLDFGLARGEGLDLATLTRTGLAVGTPSYMSPEQFEGRPLDGRTDVYSLGVVLHEALSGRLPFQAPTPLAMALKHKTELPPPLRLVRPESPAWLERVVLTCLHKDPARRHASAAALASELSRVHQGPQRRKLPSGDWLIEDEAHDAEWSLVLATAGERAGWTPGLALRFAERYHKLARVTPPPGPAARWTYRFTPWPECEVFRRLLDYEEDSGERAR